MGRGLGPHSACRDPVGGTPAPSGRMLRMSALRLTRLAQLSRESRATTAPATLSRRRRGRTREKSLPESERRATLRRTRSIQCPFSFWFPFPQGKGRGVGLCAHELSLGWRSRRCALGAAFEDRSAWHSTTGGPNAAHVGAPTLAARLAQLSRQSRATTAPATLSRQRGGNRKRSLCKSCVGEGSRRA